MVSGTVVHLEAADEALCRRVSERDVAAFGVLYDRYGHRVYAWAAHVLGPRQAEDTTQEVFALLWSRAGQFDTSRGTFTSWFWALARHRILRELRRARDERRRLAADEISSLLSTAVTEGVDVDEVALAATESRLALEALGQLPEEQRRVLVMSYFVGLSHSAIALELKLPLGTVKKRARLGMQKLRLALAPLEEPGRPAQTRES